MPDNRDYSNHNIGATRVKNSVLNEREGKDFHWNNIIAVHACTRVGHDLNDATRGLQGLANRQ
ncbi:MAG: hypothetical protein ISR73_09585 [Gammaproteobacteria bacterium]|nr:hypothetical protein [Gammaproteobacteria bacterium]